jgi:hypothetical protein
VRGHDDIGKCDQALEHVVLNDALGKIFIEQVGFLFIDVETEIADLLGLQSFNDCTASTSAPQLVLIIMTPFFILEMLSTSIRWNVCGVSGQ